MSLPSFVQKARDHGWLLLVRAQPGAKISEFSGELDGRLRVRLAAPAVENKANKVLVAHIAKALGLRGQQVRIVKGDTGRQKTLLIEATEEPDWTKLL